MKKTKAVIGIVILIFLLDITGMSIKGLLYLIIAGIGAIIYNLEAMNNNITSKSEIDFRNVID
ncbi:MAG: hypothetical protein GY870_06915 [archaeon]|nr:hypothetical protein [archaeon]